MTTPPTTPPAMAPVEECLDVDPVAVPLPDDEGSRVLPVGSNGVEPVGSGVGVKTRIVPLDVLVTAIGILRRVEEPEDAPGLDEEVGLAELLCVSSVGRGAGLGEEDWVVGGGALVLG